MDMIDGSIEGLNNTTLNGKTELLNDISEFAFFWSWQHEVKSGKYHSRSLRRTSSEKKKKKSSFIPNVGHKVCMSFFAYSQTKKKKMKRPIRTDINYTYPL